MPFISLYKLLLKHTRTVFLFVCFLAPLGGSDRGSDVSRGPNDIHSNWKMRVDLTEPIPLPELPDPLDVNSTLLPNKGKSQSKLTTVTRLVIPRNVGASTYTPFSSAPCSFSGELCRLGKLLGAASRRGCLGGGAAGSVLALPAIF